MFVALRVVTPSHVRRHERELKFSRAAVVRTSLGEYRVQISAAALRNCLSASTTAELAAQCSREHPLALTLSRPSAGNSAAIETRTVGWKVSEGPQRLELPVPLSDDAGGLLRELSMNPRISYEEVREGDTARFRLSSRSRVVIALDGTRLETLRRPDGWDW